MILVFPHPLSSSSIFGFVDSSSDGAFMSDLARHFQVSKVKNFDIAAIKSVQCQGIKSA